MCHRISVHIGIVIGQVFLSSFRLLILNNNNTSMNSEIKFRGQNLKSEWVHGDLIQIGGGALIYHGDKQTVEAIPQEDSPCAVGFYQNEISPVKPNTICQFVKKDQYRGFVFDIYDKDIVLVEVPYDEAIYKAEVFYDKQTYAFRLKIFKSNGVFLDYLTVMTIHSVIGNSIDNPELLVF